MPLAKEQFLSFLRNSSLSVWRVFPHESKTLKVFPFLTTWIRCEWDVKCAMRPRTYTLKQRCPSVYISMWTITVQNLLCFNHNWERNINVNGGQFIQEVHVETTSYQRQIVGTSHLNGSKTVPYDIWKMRLQIHTLWSVITVCLVDCREYSASSCG